MIRAVIFSITSWNLGSLALNDASCCAIRDRPALTLNPRLLCRNSSRLQTPSRVQHALGSLSSRPTWPGLR